MPTVYFAHGKESGPWGTKIQHLAAIARRRGCQVESPDYSAIPDPDARVDLLLGLASGKPDLLLVGSSMGGYVSTVAAHTLDTRGLFLMAPALYIPGYRAQRYHPSTRRIAVVHGWHDDIVPVQHSIEFARETHSELCILDGGHRLNEVLPVVGQLFEGFLQRVLESCQGGIRRRHPRR